MLRPKQIHSVQIWSVNTSLPIGTDKQMNITGIEMQKDFRCVDLLMQCMTLPLHHQSETLIFCAVHIWALLGLQPVYQKPSFSGQIWTYKKFKLKYFGSESKYFVLEKLYLRHCTPARDILSTRMASVPPCDTHLPCTWAILSHRIKWHSVTSPTMGHSER